MDKREVLDVTIAYTALLAMFARLNLHMMYILSVPLFTAFILHEYGHILTARKFGYEARFMMWPKWLGLSILLFAVSRGTFVFAIPGAATIFTYSPVNPYVEKEIAAAGPKVNLVNGLVFLVGAYLYPSPIFGYSSFLNAWLGLFNLIPIYPLDGSKVVRVSKKEWALLVLGNASVLFATFFSPSMSMIS